MSGSSVKIGKLSSTNFYLKMYRNLEYIYNYSRKYLKTVMIFKLWFCYSYFNIWKFILILIQEKEYILPGLIW